MTTDKSHVGTKLAAEMERLRVKPPQIAALFDVKIPSVYDWIKHGRIHKRHYPALVAWSGRSIEWWLGMPEVKKGATSVSTGDDSSHKARQEPAKYKIAHKQHAELIDLFDALPASAQIALIADLRQKKQQYAALLAELLHRTPQ